MAMILPILRLLRAGTLFSPAADVVAGLCLLGLPWSPAAATAVLASVLVYAGGMVWNDIADRHEDARQRPERPLPSGQLPLTLAIAIGVLLLGGALVLSPCRLQHGALVIGVLFYDFLGKKVALIGAATMGLLRGGNLAIASGLGAVAPDHLRVLLIAAACYGCYIVAVTILGIFEDSRSVSPRAVVAIQTAPPLAALVGLTTAQNGLWPAPALALLPILWFARRNRQTAVWDQRAIRRSMMFLLLGTMLYTALLCLASSRYPEALAVALAIAPARLIARKIALT